MSADIAIHVRFNGNGMTTMRPAADRESRIAEAQRQLRDEFIDALKAGPQTLIRTPGFGRTRHCVAYVISDRLSGRDEGESEFDDLLQIVQAAADGKDVRLRAMGWIAKQARVFSDWHASDLVDQEG